METSETAVEQSISEDKNNEMGDDSADTELEYFPKIENYQNQDVYKVYNNKF